MTASTEFRAGINPSSGFPGTQVSETLGVKAEWPQGHRCPLHSFLLHTRAQSQGRDRGRRYPLRKQGLASQGAECLPRGHSRCPRGDCLAGRPSRKGPESRGLSPEPRTPRAAEICSSTSAWHFFLVQVESPFMKRGLVRFLQLVLNKYGFYLCAQENSVGERPQNEALAVR